MRKFKIIICFMIAVSGMFFSGCINHEPSTTLYIQSQYERVWNWILREVDPPIQFRAVQAWDAKIEPPETGIWITTEPWEIQGRAEVYFRLSYDLEYRGAIVLALDPWMVFRKHLNPGLTVNRVYQDAGGDGLLLIPGKDPESVQAWVSRLVQKSPGVFPSDEKIWQECENNLFRGNRFLQGAQSYNWQDVFFRLMGNQQAWVYAPLSVIRNYSNSKKAILEATAFPETPENNQYSLHANKILWAVPVGSEEDKEMLDKVLVWLKNPEIQTIIADYLGWIPADPYGIPYDPVSQSSHRNWLTASYVYVVN